MVDISIHALRKESDLSKSRHVALTLISIHALRKESDSCYLRVFASVCISIHALRKESDLITQAYKKPINNFNPRSP